MFARARRCNPEEIHRSAMWALAAGSLSVGACARELHGVGNVSACIGTGEVEHVALRADGARDVWTARCELRDEEGRGSDDLAPLRYTITCAHGENESVIEIAARRDCITFALCDVSGDRTPELVVESATGQGQGATSRLQLFSLIGGATTEILSTPLSGRYFCGECSGEGQIVTWWRTWSLSDRAERGLVFRGDSDAHSECATCAAFSEDFEVHWHK